MAKRFSGIIERQSDAAKILGAIQHLPPVRLPTQAATCFKCLLNVCEFPIALRTRTRDGRRHNALPARRGEADGPERAAALKRTFEYIEDKLCEVTLVFGVHEERNFQSYDYLVLLFSDGSQPMPVPHTSGTGVRLPPRLGSNAPQPKFRFHVGLLDDH